MVFLAFIYDKANFKSNHALFGMALSAHDGTFPMRQVTALAIHMKCPSQARLIPGAVFLMALGAAQVLGRFILQFFSIFINMMALVAFFYFGQFIVFVMSKNNRGTLFRHKTAVVDNLHILLGKGR
jgi:hypothetical protein